MKKEEIINALIKIFKAGISFEYIGDFYCKFKYIGLLFKVNAARKSKVDDNTARMQSIKQLGV